MIDDRPPADLRGAQAGTRRAVTAPPGDVQKSDAHLHSAARAWCRVLAARHPEHTFYPVVRPIEDAVVEQPNPDSPNTAEEHLNR